MSLYSWFFPETKSNDQVISSEPKQEILDKSLNSKQESLDKIKMNVLKVDLNDHVPAIITTDYAEFTYFNKEIYKGPFTHGMRHGKGQLSYPNPFDGEELVHETDNDVPKKYGNTNNEFTYNQGYNYNGYWYNDKKHGKGVMSKYCVEDGVCYRYDYSGEWVKDKMHGPFNVTKILYVDGDYRKQVSEFTQIFE